MTQPTSYRAVSGTNRPMFVGTEDGKPAATENVALIFQLRRRARGKLQTPDSHMERPKPCEILKAELSADDEDVQLVLNFANQNDLWIDKIDAHKRLIHAHRSTRTIEKAFHIELNLVKRRGRKYRVRMGEISLPEHLHEVITGVFGIDERPQARPHIERCKFHLATFHKPSAFDGQKLATIYEFPHGDGAEQCIALIEFGGGYWLEDLGVFFQHLLPSDCRKCMAYSLIKFK